MGFALAGSNPAVSGFFACSENQILTSILLLKLYLSGFLFFKNDILILNSSLKSFEKNISKINVLFPQCCVDRDLNFVLIQLLKQETKKQMSYRYSKIKIMHKMVLLNILLSHGYFTFTTYIVHS